MPELTVEILTIVLIGTFIAGFIDAVVGGGGLIGVPLLFAAFPHLPPATLLGTNKCAGIFGTASAAWRYAQTGQVPWRAALWGAGTALIFAAIGAWAVTRVPVSLFRPALPVILLLVFIYTLMKKDFGQTHAPRLDPRQEVMMAIGMGAALGFYDGVFGPGTGSFLVFAFARLFGYDFLHASAGAKVINVACNLGALAWFIPAGQVWWTLGLMMAVFNIAGAQIGSKLAVKNGAAFVRTLFLIVVPVLICKTAYDAFLK